MIMTIDKIRRAGLFGLVGGLLGFGLSWLYTQFGST